MAGLGYRHRVDGLNALTGEDVGAWLREHEPAVDAALAGVLFGCCLWFGLAARTPPAYYVLSVPLVLPLAVRRRWPALGLVVVLAAALVQWLTVRHSIGAMPADLAVPVAIEGAAAYGPAWASGLGLGAGLAGAGLGGLTWPQRPTAVLTHGLTAAFLASVVVASWTIGALSRQRRRHVQAIAERARLLEVERDQRDQLAVLAERARIAREMHDVVAHSLAGIIAQADGGRYAGSFDAARTALTTIGDHGRQALAESRRVLGVLRDGAGEPAGPGSHRLPGLHDIPELAGRVRAGGLDVRLRLAPPPEPVEPELSLVVYRVVQEGLTNVMKHAVAATRADVTVRGERHELTITVADDGQGPPALAGAGAGGGYGLAGMRERVAAYGGTVSLRPDPGGGHVLSVQIPVRR